jgi:hypothetical protein
MRQLRKYLCWVFAIAALTFFQSAASSILLMVHRHHAFRSFRTMLVPVMLSALTAVYGSAWWTIWKGKRSARGWGIAASLTTILLPVSIIYFLPSVWTHLWLLAAIGIVGLAAFSRRYEEIHSATRAHVSHRIPGDGTSNLLNRSVGFISTGVVLATLIFVGRWSSARGVSEIHGFGRRAISIVLVLLVITILHEVGHTVTGLALGMRLRAFVVGPFQWRVRGGKWNFQFKLADILSAGGATGVVPATTDFPRSRYLVMTAAGPLVNLLTGIIALIISFAAEANSSAQVGGRLALFGALSVTLCAFNLLPFKTGDNYSDGANIHQLLSRGPWSDFHAVVAVVGSSLVTPLRPRNYDIDAIQRAAQCIRDGKQAMLLRLYAYIHYLDEGKNFEAGQALSDAEAVYHRSAAEIPAELHTEFVFGNAYVRRDAVAAREWWTRMEAKKPTRFSEDYWRASSALHWIEGNLREANEAWEKCKVLAQELPEAGAYEFDRYCCLLLRKALDGASVARLPTRTR